MANVRNMGSVATLGTKSITANGTYNASADNVDGFSQVIVNVPVPPEPILGTKTITENGTYNASSDNLDGYSQVSVNVPSDIQIPAYQNFAYAYLATDNGFYHDNTDTDYLNVWEVEAGIYLIAIGEEAGNRNRCGRKVGYTYNDIEQYLTTIGSLEKIFDMDYVQAYDDQLLSRHIVTMPDSGIIILGTSNSISYSPNAYCIKIGNNS